MMRTEHSDLSPRLSLEVAGHPLSSLGFDGNRSSSSPQEHRRGVGLGERRVGVLSLSSPPAAIASPAGTGTGTTALVIKEEDLRLLSDAVGGVLEGADETLRCLETDRALLPSAILRKCNEIADGLASLAAELEGQSPEERNRLADAIGHDLRLCDEALLGAQGGGAEAEIDAGNPASASDAFVVGNERDEVLRALSGASTLLRDMETSFREIGDEEAEEIADAALITARLFLLSLESFYSNLVENLDRGDDRGRCGEPIASGVFIEELAGGDGDGGSDGDGGAEPLEEHRAGRTRESRRHAHRRMRVLWPALGPGVDTAMAWTREEATRRPFLAVALGLTLWPVALSTALLGTSVALIDGAVQEAYDRFKDGPWISALEHGAAQAYQAGRLSVATGRLVGRQGLRVAARQIERRGGLGPVALDLGGMALDKIAHPIDTIGKAWDGLHWGFGAVRDTAEEFLSVRRERRESMV